MKRPNEISKLYENPSLVFFNAAIKSMTALGEHESMHKLTFCFLKRTFCSIILCAVGFANRMEGK